MPDKINLETANEFELRDYKVPFDQTWPEIETDIEILVNRNHDYGTCCYAASIAATMAFNYVCSKLGMSGFQASCADLDVLKRTRGLTGPFGFYDVSNMLYPQYNVLGRIEEVLNSNDTRKWLKGEAQKNLDSKEFAHPNVIAHWKKLAAYEIKDDSK